MQCATCCEDKPIDEFEVRRNREGQRRTSCRACRAAYNREWAAKNRELVNGRARAKYAEDPSKSIARAQGWNAANGERKRDAYLRRKYGISLARYNEMLVEQDGRCASCKCEESVVEHRTGAPRALHVDHDHSTGKVRGLLCGRCNAALGYLLDDVGRIRALAEYAGLHVTSAP